MKFKFFEKEGLFRNILIAYIILLLHVILLAGTGVTVVLFKGVYHYLPWIMGLLGLLVLGLAWGFYQRMKTGSSDIRHILSLPEFRDRTVEIRLLGGLASVKISSDPPHRPALSGQTSADTGQLLLTDRAKHTELRLLELTNLYEKNIISKDAFDKAKQDILQG